MHHNERLTEELKERIHALSDELDTLKSRLAKQGAHAYRGAWNAGEGLVDTLGSYLHDTLPDIRRGTRRLGRQVHDNPGTTAAVAVAGLVVIGLAASVFLRRRR